MIKIYYILALFLGGCDRMFGIPLVEVFDDNVDAGSHDTLDGTDVDAPDAPDDAQAIDATTDAATSIDATAIDAMADAMADAMPEDLLFGLPYSYVCLDGDTVGWVKPSQNPNGPITISITSSAPTFIRVDSPSIPFASTEWMTYQSVTVSGLIETATLINITASAPGLMPKTLTLYVRNCY